MPLVLYLQPDAKSRVGIWRLDETAATLENLLTLDEKEKETLDNIRNEMRKQQWLGVRVLLKYLLYTQDFVRLLTTPAGKPYLPDYPFHISLSHAGKFASVIISDKEAGIDIEDISPRIERVTHKFTTPGEIPVVPDDQRLEALHVIWCAKEALFKLHGNGDLNFINHLKIHPFDYNITGGPLTASIEKDDLTIRCHLRYQRFNGSMMVYALKES